MTKLSKTLLMAGAVIFTLGAPPSIADSGINAVSGANVGAGARIQDDNAGTTAGETPESLMRREDAVRSNTATGRGLTLDNHTDVQIGAGVDTDADADIPAEQPLGDSQRMSFQDADANSDGLVDEAEFATSVDADTSARSFGEFDLNNDGALDSSEYQSYLEADSGTETEVETLE